MAWAFLLLLALLIVGVVVIIAAATHSGGRRYDGHAPHQGKVMRFTGTSSKVVDEDGKQRRTNV
jgi:uncharacterized protein YpmS